MFYLKLEIEVSAQTSRSDRLVVLEPWDPGHLGECSGRPQLPSQRLSAMSPEPHQAAHKKPPDPTPKNLFFGCKTRQGRPKDATDALNRAP